MRVIHDIYYAQNENKSQTLHLYLPDSDKFSVFVYIHGGGLTEGSYADAENFAELLTGKNIAVASVEYRMYPLAHYPDFIYDSAAAVAWVFNNISAYGKCDSIFVGGTSAGGYISMMLCFDEKYLAPFNISTSDIAGFFHDAGQCTTHFNVLKERGLDPRRCIIDEAAPIYHIGKSSAYPPMMFIVSDNDMPARLEQKQLAIATLKHFGYDESGYGIRVIENSGHCQYLNETDSDGINKLGKMIYEFIIGHLKNE